MEKALPEALFKVTIAVTATAMTGWCGVQQEHWALADNDNSGILCIIMDDALPPACVHVLAYILTSQAQRARRACTVHHVPPDPGQAETRGGGEGGRERERAGRGGREIE